MDDLNLLTEKIKLLSGAYAAKLPQQLDQMETLWDNLPRDTWDEAGFDTLYRMVHSLTGSGKTFGFAALSDAARDLEIDLKKMVLEKSILDQQRTDIAEKITKLRLCSLKPEAILEQISALPNIVADARRIYIVDDDIDFAASLEHQFSYFGFAVTVFNNLADFKLAISQNSNVAVIMDISFPEDNRGGVHIMQEVQLGREVPVPVVFLSSYDGLDARLAAVRAGGIAYFNKEVNPANLLDKLDELTSRQAVAAYRVLIVDDSPSLTAFYTAVLERAGMNTVSVNDPLAVMKPLQEFSPDLILIDMYMPGCNGMELARVIRQMEGFVSIPIVFLSSESDPGKQLAAIDLGADDFLRKPIQPQYLVTSVISRIRRSHLLRSLMIRDSLTGLLNHTAIKDQLEREVLRAKRQNTRCCFAMIDIDYFKKVNDTYGHPAGDRVLKSLSRLLRQTLRGIDSVGRYGGEEFAVILIETDVINAAIVLNKIRDDFSQLPHSTAGQEFKVTFSCGIADMVDFPDGNALCDAADKALYKAKHEGRNRVVIAEK
jgi:diguanylate cyclase (GGDEF)-like protein